MNKYTARNMNIKASEEKALVFNESNINNPALGLVLAVPSFHLQVSVVMRYP